MSIPADLRYTKEHEWAHLEDDGVVTIGVTDHAQEALGDVVYVEMPKEGDQLIAGQPFGVVESVKSVSDLYAPLSGTVAAINVNLEEQPELINAEAYTLGWIVRIVPDDVSAFGQLMDADAYRAFLAAEKH